MVFKGKYSFFAPIILGLAVVTLVVGFFKIGQFEVYYPASEESCKKYTEDNYLGKDKRAYIKDYNKRIAEKVAFENCYYDYFLPKNCNWLQLESIMEKQTSFISSQDDLAALQADAKALEGRGLKPCSSTYEASPNNLPASEKFWFKNSDSLIESYLLVGDLGLLKVHENLYAGISRQVKMPILKPDGSSAYEWSNGDFTLLAVEVSSNTPKILQKYSFSIPKNINGPYYFQASRTRWVIFSRDLTTCQVVNLEEGVKSLQFVDKPCKFNSQGIIQPEEI